ncbi:MULTISPECIES: NAD(P)/FAD-dependent oxidoreductase [unclassified Beijerinckia]|uniref:flavin monoamine oxidase family protein n=1 Tax=unclassified Beijerinckia TaxID=2638183 RepID=UPI0008965E23|nr:MULTISPECIES: NAD(P)/FAD-dependent oxidoreductase [unclassified Beijerinckia]MDH7799307.1 monoamine oxidase [Beijerinckia sp. GAS462]SED45690.1 monoamine oxidase [Beijerinckia sp. 28-YEA-48]
MGPYVQLMSDLADVDVVVVGAGAAGVAAGHALARAGLRFVVLEARSRVGGRAWSIDGFSPYGLDLGCGWLHSADDNPLVGITRSLGLTVDETTPPWQREMPEQGFPADAQRGFRDAQNSFYERMEAEVHKAGDRPAAELLEPGNRWNPLIDAISTYVNGVELDRLSVRDFDNYHDSRLNYRVVEGYGTLIARSGAALPVITECPVETIDHSGSRIIVTCAKGRVSARAVIVTVPTNLLARDVIRFTPDLPEKRDAASVLPLGLDDKLFLRVDKAEELPENSRQFGALDRRATGAYHYRPFGLPVIEGYFGGQCARDLEKEGLAGFTAFAREELVRMLGSQWRDRLTSIAVSSWEQDPYALGSYSHALPGHWDKRAVLAQPVDDRLFFAGEATSPHYFSTAHGAHESGERAAAEALQALNISVADQNR